MLSDAAEPLSSTFASASDILDYDLWDLIQTGPEEKLNQTEFTQPALLAASVGLWRLAQDAGARTPDVVAGHSLGEYAALVAAESITFEDAISLVQKRGQFMQSAVPLGEGSMAAILGLEDEQVTAICERQADEQIIQAANFNAPGQVVVAGHVGALERVIAAAKEAGAKRAMQLAVSAPFHCALMEPAAANMRGVLADVTFNEPKIAVIQNVHANYSTDPDEIRSNLVAQMSNAVLWTNTIQRMVGDGVEQIIECGPGKVLSGLNRRIDKAITSGNISSLDSLSSSIAGLV